MEHTTPSSKRVITVGVLALLNISIMASLRNLPLVAQYGLGAIFYFLIVAILFLIPSALISAELATGWPKSGGVYIWVREAFGDRLGFIAIWMQWIHNVAWYPVILTFVATTLAYIIDPSLAENKYYTISVVLTFFWAMTFINYLGIKTSSLFSSIGVITGTIIPGAFIIACGVAYLLLGKPSNLTFELKSLIPSYQGVESLVFLCGLFLSFTGFEVSASYAANVKNPQKNYPKSIVIAALAVFAIFMLGSLSIAVVLPKDDINIVSGLLDAFEKFLNVYNLAWTLPILAILLVIGAIAEVNSWIIGPVRGLHSTAVHGNLPPILRKANKDETPTNLLFFQAIIVTITTIVFLFMPSVSSAFWILTALSAQSYLTTYILMFAAAIKLRYSKPLVPRAYKIPYNHSGIWFFAVLGIIASTLAIIAGFIPPSQLDTGSYRFYLLFLSLFLLGMIGLPILVHIFKKPHWAIPSKDPSK